MFRRGLPHVGWIVGYVLLLWLLVTILTEVRQPLEARGRRLVVTLADYTIQTLLHGILLFVLPAYYASATLLSANVLFLLLLVALAVLATFDPWYSALVHPRGWLRTLFLLVAVFAALNVALPLVGVPPFAALVASAALAVLAVTPTVRRKFALDWGGAARVTVAAAVIAATAAALGRAFVPPVPLFLAERAVVRDVRDGQPVEAVAGAISADELRRGGVLVAYTAVYAPAGLRQPIVHAWRHGGRTVTVVPLSPVRGGRREGFRTYSRKATWPADPAGRWTVDVLTASGQLIGRLRFEVTP